MLWEKIVGFFASISLSLSFRVSLHLSLDASNVMPIEVPSQLPLSVLKHDPGIITARYPHFSNCYNRQTRVQSSCYPTLYLIDFRAI